jgi:predicted small metal-binding protein
LTYLSPRRKLDPVTEAVCRKERSMAKSAACADMGMDCPGSFTVETEDELMQHLEIHAKAAHPELEMTPEVVEQIKGAIKTV